MRLPATSLAVTAALLVGSLPVTAVAQSTGLEDMVGARAGQAEGEILRRGYRNVRGEKGDDRSYTYWWNADRRQCVTVATMNGRYASITPTTAPDCRQPASVRPRPDDGTRPPDYVPDRNDGHSPYRPGDGRPGILPGSAIVDGQAVDLGLVCFGDGQRDTIASGTTWTWNRDRDRYDYGRYNQLTAEQFDASLTVQLWDGGGRIRLPKSLVPPIHSRGSSGWWELDDVSTGSDVITASYRLNGLNKPRLTIDRRSGRIMVQGLSNYSFRGTCDLIGDNARRF